MSQPISVFMFVIPSSQSNIRLPDPKPEPKKEQYDFSSVQVDLQPAAADKVLKFAKSIKDEDLADKGREGEPHITALYGLHTENPDEVAEVLRRFGKVRAKIGTLSVFDTDKADVLKFDVESPDLHRMNKLLRRLDFTNDYPDYKPHITVAYLKKGKGKEYMKAGSLKGQDFEFSEVVFSSRDGKKTTIAL